MTIDMRAVALPLAVMHLFAQNPPPLPLPSEPPGPEIQRQWHEAQQRVTATGRLSVTLTTDRSLYFVGEDPELVITIENPTPRPLTVVQPFLYGTSSINTMRRPLGSSGEWDWQLENPDPITYQMPDPPLLVMLRDNGFGKRSGFRKTARLNATSPRPVAPVTTKANISTSLATVAVRARRIVWYGRPSSSSPKSSSTGSSIMSIGQRSKGRMFPLDGSARSIALRPCISSSTSEAATSLPGSIPGQHSNAPGSRSILNLRHCARVSAYPIRASEQPNSTCPSIPRTISSSRLPMSPELLAASI